MSRRNVTLKVYRIGEEPPPAELSWTPSQRLAQVWAITLLAYQFRGIDASKSRLQRNLVRIRRRRR